MHQRAPHAERIRSVGFASKDDRLYSDIACPGDGRNLPAMLTLRPLPSLPDGSSALVERPYRPFKQPAEASTWAEKLEASELPYGGAWEYLDDWLSLPRDLISAYRAGSAAPPDPAGRFAYLLARTESTVVAGVDVPLERFVRANCLDDVDRLLLVALLDDALSSTSDGGVCRADLIAAAGAVGRKAQDVVRTRLEVWGDLRSLDLLECDLDGPPSKRYYRLAPRMVPILVHGEPRDLLEGAGDTRVLDGVCNVVGELVLAVDATARGENPRCWFAALPDTGQWAAWRGPALKLLDVLQALRRRPSHRLTNVMVEGKFNDAECLLLLLLVHAAWSGLGDVPAGFASSVIERVLGQEVPPLWLSRAPCHPTFSPLIEVSKESDPAVRRMRLSAEGAARLLSGTPGVRKPEEVEEAKNPLWVEVKPAVTLGDLILPPGPKEDLAAALENVRSAGLIFGQWGFGEAAHCGDGAILLFEGPPGTGKTFAAEAIAGELKRPLLRASIEKLTSKWFGKTEKAISRLFREAARQTAVLLLDEADSLLSTRHAEDPSWVARHVNVLLQEVEAFKGILVLTTNRAAVLDPALERRLTARVHFPVPGPDERERLWQVSLPKTAPVRGGVDFRTLAEHHVLTGSQIRSACLAAARRAAMRTGEERVIRQDDLEAAARKTARKPDAPAVGFLRSAAAPTGREPSIAIHAEMKS